MHQHCSYLWLIVIASCLQIALIFVYINYPLQALLAALACCGLIFLPLLGSYYAVGFTMCSLTAAFGGLGMLVGVMIDQVIGNVGVTTHHIAHTRIGYWFNWSNSLMLTFCSGVCWLFCPIYRNRYLKLSVHTGYLLMMFVGMQWAMDNYGGLLIDELGCDGSMLVTMMIGMIVGILLFECGRLLVQWSISYAYHRTSVSR